jgi:hypothetical protein
MKPRSAKAKGTRLEKWVAQKLSGIGIFCRRQPGSGIYRDFQHDNYAVIPLVGPILLECKSWKHGWRTGDKAMGKAEILIIKRDYGNPCVYMPWSTFSSLVSALQQAKEDE